MAQHDYVIANGTGAAVRSDLNNALAAIVSQNSGATAPSTTYAYMPWADTTTGLFKIRNAANNGWITLYELDGTFSIEAGSASSPGLYFTGDSNTGIYSPGADQFGISTGGTSRLTIDASGNINMDSGTVYVDAANNRLGIGSTAPSQKLELDSGGNTTPVYQAFTGGNERFRIGYSYTTAPTNSDAFGSVFVNSSGQLLLADRGASSGGTLFYTGGSERGRWDSSGRFLVGTSTGSSSFDGITPQLQVEGTSYPTSSASLFVNANNAIGAYLVLGKSRGTAIGSSSIVQNGDQIGGFIFVGADGTDRETPAAYIQAFVDGTPGANDMPGRLVFSTTADGASSPTERLRIASDGQVFQYANQYNFSSSLSTIEFVNRNSGGAKTFQWYVGASGGAPVATLSTAGVWTNASDAKNKENIEDIAYGIETLKQLRPRQYDVKSDGSHNIGFVAQEVQPLIPEIVNETVISTTGESHLGLAYGSLTAVLTKALQEAIAKIETLEAKVAALEAS